MYQVYICFSKSYLISIGQQDSAKYRIADIAERTGGLFNPLNSLPKEAPKVDCYISYCIDSIRYSLMQVYSIPRTLYQQCIFDPMFASTGSYRKWSLHIYGISDSTIPIFQKATIEEKKYPHC